MAFRRKLVLAPATIWSQEEQSRCASVEGGFLHHNHFKCTLRAVLLVAELGLLTPSVVLVVVAVLVMVVAVQ